ncbi:hypothetical protein [Anthocerotibacter panamensis]|uniref:hypothetical protein n=1 Tax=Anthocerotibacter panamensis TaxID=2857077 RepID=UPI001C406ECE|nr:hypothetical protein [Anthocerotibacter panamensis]
MTENLDLQEIVKKEFSCQYLPSEVPIVWDSCALQVTLPAMAKASALRMREQVSPEQIEELSTILETALHDQEHPLIETICGINMVDWREEDEDWNALQELLSMIAKNLKE